MAQQSVTKARRPGKCHARPKIFLAGLVKARPAVCRAGPIKGDKRIVARGLAVRALRAAIQIKLIQVGGWRDLKLIGLPGRSSVLPPHTERQGKGRFDLPGVLRIEFVGVNREAPLNGAAITQRAAVALEIVASVDFCHDAKQRGKGEVVRVREAGSHLWKSPIHGVQRGTWFLRIARSGCPRGISASVAERGQITYAGGAGEGSDPAELPGVLSTNPRDIVGKRMNRPLKAAGAGNGSSLIVKATEVDPILIGISDIADTFSNKAITEIIDDRAGEHATVVHD